MADNFQTQNTGALPANMNIGTREVSYSGDTVQVQVSGLTEFTGSDDAKTAVDVPIGSMLGQTNETAPASDTATAGHNGRLQRIAQRLTSMIALLPTALGTGGGLKVDNSANDFATNVAKVGGNAINTQAGTVGTGTARVTVATDDALNTVLGATADAVVNAGAVGSISAKLRAISRDIVGSIVLQAGTALIGTISASHETNTIYNGTTALTPKKAKIVASSSGATQVIALVSAKKLRVLSLVLTSNGTVNVKFQSHVTPTDLTGLLYLVANTGVSASFDPTGHFETIAGEALDINLSGAIAVGGWLTYIEV